AQAQAAPLTERQRARSQLRGAFAAADELLRHAVTLARTETSGAWQGSFVTWSLWRDRLSRLDAERQAHLFADQDDLGVLPVGSVRAVDTGMSGPAIGDKQHGHSRPPGTPARVGVDIAEVVNAVDTASHRRSQHVRNPGGSQPVESAAA
ncbi:MAG: hypothetical protein ACRDVZ_05900, partial [Jiangellaceae bacterium]